MGEPVLPSSPRIEELRRTMESGDSDVLAQFWRDIEQVGTPLIEPAVGGSPNAADSSDYLVTFLYRDASEERRNVVVCSHALGWSFQRNRMAKLPGTDVWYRTFRLPAGARTSYWLSPDDSLVYLIDMEDRAERMSTWRPDPLARHTFIFPMDDEIPGDQDFVCSMLETPGAPVPEWSVKQSHVPAGKVEMYRIQSSILQNKRRVWVYTPPGYASEPVSGQDSGSEQYHLLVIFDGFAYLRVIPTSTILDNLLAAEKLPPFVALLVDNVDRNLELPCYAPFTDFLVKELLPWARERYGVTSDPARTVVAGSSYGGLSAVYAGLRYSEVFGRVLSQSGAFWWRPERSDPMSEDSIIPHEWLIQRFVETERLPLQFYLDVGIFENGFKDPSMLVANRHMRDVLRAKGYPITYAEYVGGHDYPWWEITLPQGLLALAGAGVI
jgi:enterochelin esterase-like enzyme